MTYQTVQKTVHTEHGETSVEVAECALCNNEKPADRIDGIARDPDYREGDYSTCPCGGYMVGKVHPVCEECQDTMFELEYSNRSKEKTDSRFGDVDYETETCHVCECTRTKQQIETVGTGVEKHSHNFSTCGGGRYSIETERSICDYCAGSLFEQLDSSQSTIQYRGINNKNEEKIAAGVIAIILLVVLFSCCL